MYKQKRIEIGKEKKAKNITTDRQNKEAPTTAITVTLQIHSQRSRPSVDATSSFTKTTTINNILNGLGADITRPPLTATLSADIQNEIGISWALQSLHRELTGHHGRGLWLSGRARAKRRRHQIDKAVPRRKSVPQLLSFGLIVLNTFTFQKVLILQSSTKWNSHRNGPYLGHQPAL